MAMEGVELDFREDALRSVARKAMQRKTGARGLRSIMEGILLDTMYDLPGLEGVEQVVIGPEVPMPLLCFHNACLWIT